MPESVGIELSLDGVVAVLGARIGEQIRERAGDAIVTLELLLRSPACRMITSMASSVRSRMKCPITYLEMQARGVMPWGLRHYWKGTSSATSRTKPSM